MEKTDEILVRESQKGERLSFARLVERFRIPMIGFLSGLLRSRDDAEEVAQEAFLVAWQKLPTLRDANRFSPWFFRIARNLASQRVRRSRRIPTVAMPRDPPDEARSHDVAGGLEEAVGRSELLLARLAQLEDVYLEVVMRKHFAGQDGETIARQLNIKPGTVRSRLSRAYAKLRKLLSEST